LFNSWKPAPRPFRFASPLLMRRFPRRWQVRGIVLKLSLRRQVLKADLDNVAVELTVVLGSAQMPIYKLLRMGRGAIIELNATENDEVQILANNHPFAKGHVVVAGTRISGRDHRDADAPDRLLARNRRRRRLSRPFPQP
jgi:flagellar motor switch protein FliN/FliY